MPRNEVLSVPFFGKHRIERHHALGVQRFQRVLNQFGAMLYFDQDAVKIRRYYDVINIVGSDTGIEVPVPKYRYLVSAYREPGIQGASDVINFHASAPSVFGRKYLFGHLCKIA